MLISSRYGHVNYEGAYEFISVADLDWEELKQEIDFLEIDWEKFGAAYFDETNYGPNDPNAEWKGMPEIGDTIRGVRMLIVHFETQQDVDNFSDFIGQKIGEKTKYIWYPQKSGNEE